MVYGLWGQDVRFQGSVFKNHYELATVIIYCIFFAAIIWAWSQVKKPSLRPGESDIVAKSKGPFNRLRVGVQLLMIWYAFTILNIFLIETRAKVKYGYLLINVWITALKLFADIFLLVVAHRVCTCMMSRYRGKLAAYWLLTGDFLAIVLAATALYYIGSTAATEILFLNEADSSLIQDMHGRELKLQAAFYFVQASLSIFVLVGVILHIMRCAEVFGHPLSSTRHAFKAIVFIFIRNLSELIVNLQYGLFSQNAKSYAVNLRYGLFNHNAKSYVPVAQGIVYGLCSYLFLHYITKAGRPVTLTDLAYEILAEGRHIARSEIVKQIEDDIADGRRPLPMQEVLEEMLVEPYKTLPADREDRMRFWPDDDIRKVVQEHRKFLEGLLEKHGGRGRGN
ncbi:hypothetical protein AOQ84DRAFT_435167 [Glonium stellatum]|uniref:Uncharacterized protein n=1 Tax=Glonium stellatum TaxID=574774 RepID=A0A8E2FDW1_9PEZI|nr:hypothetical protein AOQ84DRAFT_435167 [Glonium stellatum]